MQKLIGLLVLAGSVGLFGQQQPVPVRLVTQVSNMEPRVVKPGSVLTITGKSLDSSKVGEVFLTDHRFDMKVKVLEQSEQVLKIRVPPFAKPGRQQLLVLTAGENGAYLELPMYVLIEEDEVAAAVVPGGAGAGTPAGANGNHPE